VIAEDNGARCFASEMAKDLRAFTIEAFAKDNVRRDGVLPPIAFDVPVAFDVTHVG
jgi:hypothetical protein